MFILPHLLLYDQPLLPADFSYNLPISHLISNLVRPTSTYKTLQRVYEKVSKKYSKTPKIYYECNSRHTKLLIMLTFT